MFIPTDASEIFAVFRENNGFLGTVRQQNGKAGDDLQLMMPCRHFFSIQKTVCTHSIGKSRTNAIY